MSTVQLVQRHTSTSPFIDYDELRQGTQYKMRHSSGMAYQQGVQALGDGSFAPSLPSTSYSSPHPSHVMLDDWQRPYIHRGENEIGVWRQYVSQNGLDEPTLWPYRSGEYQQRPSLQLQHSYPNPQLHGRSPMMLASDYGTSRQTKQGTPELDSNQAFSRTATASKRKTPKKPKAKAKRAALEKPLSELTKDLTNIQVKDTEAWVNRSFEERHREKRPDGSIKRPSNSFMLYRSAYTESCRELEKSKNHQDISSIAGASWAIETTQIKIQFEEWAKMERENHQKAFPDYKFQPQTQAAKERKRKRKQDETSEEASDPEDLTYYNRPGGGDVRRSLRAKNGRSTYREFSDSPTLTSQDEANTPEPYILSQNASYFSNANPGKPLPQALDRLTQPGGYYITSNTGPNFGTYGYPSGEEDMQFYPVDETQYGMVSPPTGLPGASHSDLIGGLPMDGGHVTLSGTSLMDPELERHEYGPTVSMAPPESARSGSFQPNDYLVEDDGIPYLSQFDVKNEWEKIG